MKWMPRGPWRPSSTLGSLFVILFLFVLLTTLHNRAVDEPSTAPPNRPQPRSCANREDTRRFLPSPLGVDANSSHYRVPPLLYSFPGSGNTWLRLLIDFSTNVYSGSVYSDKSLLKILPGERKCDGSVSVIKAHPHLQTFAHFNSGDLPSKCTSLLRHLPVSRMVFLLRDPFSSIFSEYTRRTTAGSHSRVLPKNQLQDPIALHRWMAMYKYLAAKYVDMWSEVDSFRQNGTQVLTVRFEDLQRSPRREAELDRVVDFLDVDLGNVGDVSRTEAVRCAFVLADNPVAHRLRLANDPRVLAEKDVYSRETVCDIWSILGKPASAAGYHIYKGVECYL